MLDQRANRRLTTFNRTAVPPTSVSVRPELTAERLYCFTAYPPQAGLNLKSHLPILTASIFGLPFTAKRRPHQLAARMTNSILRILDLRFTQVTAAGVKKLNAALPKCQIAR